MAKRVKELDLISVKNANQANKTTNKTTNKTANRTASKSTSRSVNQTSNKSASKYNQEDKDDSRYIKYDAADRNEYDDEYEDMDLSNDIEYSEDEYEDYTVDLGGVIDLCQEEMENKQKGKTKRKKRKIALIVAESIIIPILIFSLVVITVPGGKKWFLKTPVAKFFIGMFLSEEDFKNVIDSNYDRNGVGVNEGLDTKSMEGYYNIALFGLDSRYGELESGVHSDSIIVVSINKGNGTVKMSSIYRDTYVRVSKSDGSTYYGKVNEAYFNGGAQQAVKTLNANLDLNITDYVTVNFAGLSNIIDLLGGIDVNISKDEMVYINGYLTETRKVTGLDAPDLTTYGPVHLSGLQAVAFCRIRYVNFTDEDGQVYTADLGRTARQRRVIMKMVEKAKGLGVTSLVEVAKQVLANEDEFIYTSIPYDEIIDMIPTFIDFNIDGTVGYPYTYSSQEKIYTTDGVGLDWPLIIRGLLYNNYKLHEFLFDDKDYKPSSTVNSINTELNRQLPEYNEQRLDGDSDINLLQ